MFYLLAMYDRFYLLSVNICESLRADLLRLLVTYQAIIKSNSF